VPSIAGAALALIGIVFSWFLTPVVGLISLGLSVVWLVMKITSNVYEKVIAANQNRRKLNHGQI
jgi:phosphate/sulfate permease